MSKTQISCDNLTIEFIDDIDELDRLIDEYGKLEKAIENSVHFKLLSGKTQLLSNGRGHIIKERSRKIHTLNIANNICNKIYGKIYKKIKHEMPYYRSKEFKELFEKNQELAKLKTRCIAKAHDIGHVAFGHEGERAINSFLFSLSQRDDSSELSAILAEHRDIFGEKYEHAQGHTLSKKPKISFEHNELSGILFNQIVQNSGVNLHQEEIQSILMGILGHSTSRVQEFELLRGNLPAQIVRVADKIEYILADYREIGGLIKEPEYTTYETKKFFGIKSDINTYKDMTTQIIDKIASEALNKGRIWEDKSDNLGKETSAMLELRTFRKTYDDSIFLYDTEYSKYLLETELFPILNDSEALRKFYEDNPGIDVIYPESKVRELYELSRSDSEKYKDSLIPFKSVLQGENSERIECIYSKLLEYYYMHPEKIQQELHVQISPIDVESKQNVTYESKFNYSTKVQRVLEYISLFDDASLIEKYLELVQERIDNGPGYGVEPVTAEEMIDFILNGYETNLIKYKFKKRLDGTHSDDEVKELYRIWSASFFPSKSSNGKLTDLGKDVYFEEYKRRFKEYAIDQKLREKMEKADSERGEFSPITSIDTSNNTINDKTLEQLINCLSKIGAQFGVPLDQIPLDNILRRKI